MNSTSYALIRKYAYFCAGSCLCCVIAVTADRTLDELLPPCLIIRSHDENNDESKRFYWGPSKMPHS